jgi:hypothetical protein
MKYLFSLLICSICATSYAQNLAFSENIELEGNQINEFVGDMGDKLIISFSDDEHLSSLVKISSDFSEKNQVRLKDLNLSFKPKNTHILGKQIILSGSKFDGERFVHTAVCAVLDSNLTFVKELELTTMTVNSNANIGRFIFKNSKNNEFLYILEEAPIEKGEDQRIKLHQYKEDMELMFSKSYNTHIESHKSQHNIPFVANNGAVFIAKGHRGSQGQEFHLLAFNPTSKVFKIKEIELNDGSVTQLDFALSDKNQLALAGLFSTNDFAEQGLFVELYDENLKAHYSSTQYFTEETLEFAMDKKELKNAGGLRYYIIENISVSSNNEISVFIEQVKEWVDINKKTADKTWNYMYGKTLIYTYSERGAVKGTYVLDKEQITTDDGGFWSSFATWDDQEDFKIITNIIDQKGVGAPKMNQIHYLSDNSNKQSYLDTPDSFTFTPETYYTLNNDLFFVIANKDKIIYKIGKLSN